MVSLEPKKGFKIQKAEKPGAKRRTESRDGLTIKAMCGFQLAKEALHMEVRIGMYNIPKEVMIMSIRAAE
jgi:hypothetical protein